MQSFNGHLHYPAQVRSRSRLTYSLPAVFLDQSVQAGDSDPCTVEVLGPAWDSEHRYMVDRLEDKVRALALLLIR